MSNQGEDGYFPVCLVCGRGDVGCVVLVSGSMRDAMQQMVQKLCAGP